MKKFRKGIDKFKFIAYNIIDIKDVVQMSTRYSICGVNKRSSPNVYPLLDMRGK